MYSHCPYSFLKIALLLLLTGAPRVVHAQVKVENAAAFAAIGEADMKVEKLAGGMSFTEGPVWDGTSKSLIFSDIPASRLMRWTPETGVTVMRVSEAANGNTLDREGRLISCQHGGRNVIRLEKDATETVLTGAFDRKRLNSPNDAVVKSDGSIWFTDPPYGLPKGADREQTANRVYRLDPSSGVVTAVNTDFEMPNGLAFSPDEKRLYIADSGGPRRVGVFEVKPDGTLSPAVFWIPGGSDGLKVDAAGNIYTTTGGGVRIHDPEGALIATIPCPEGPANCAFGGEDFRTLFITARTSLYSVKLKIPGARRP